MSVGSATKQGEQIDHKSAQERTFARLSQLSRSTRLPHAQRDGARAA